MTDHHNDQTPFANEVEAAMSLFADVTPEIAHRFIRSMDMDQRRQLLMIARDDQLLEWMRAADNEPYPFPGEATDG